MSVVRIIVAIMLGIIAVVGIVSFLLLELSGLLEWYSETHQIKENGFMDFMIDNGDIFFEAALSCALGLLVGSGVAVLLFA